MMEVIGAGNVLWRRGASGKYRTIIGGLDFEASEGRGGSWSWWAFDGPRLVGGAQGFESFVAAGVAAQNWARSVPSIVAAHAALRGLAIDAAEVG